MARVMSLAFTVFLAVPIVAPSVGQAIMVFGAWPRIFEVLAAIGVVVAVWTVLRLPETLHPDDRLPIAPARVTGAFVTVFTNRIAIGYMLAMALAMGGLFGFINSAQQVFVDVFDAEVWFPAIFAMIAGFMVFASLLNARIVGRIGTRRVSHTALCGYIALAVIHAVVSLAGLDTLWSFALLQGCMMFCFGLMGPNFGAMAMEPLGHIAGTAASVQGFITTVGGAMIGFYIGQQFDGTVVPLTLGFAGCGCAALAVVFVTERGRLFRPTAAALRPAAGE
jgi:DHA1 family bicyclomycin/chloramphenicol resistance-like MFS transporter